MEKKLTIEDKMEVIRAILGHVEDFAEQAMRQGLPEIGPYNLIMTMTKVVQAGHDACGTLPPPKSKSKPKPKAENIGENVVKLRPDVH